jgi:hypothetical protein
MRALLQFATRLILIFCLVGTAVGQDNRAAIAQRSGVTITASASDGRVRFTCPSSVVQVRLEVYNSAGKKLFDNELRGGNVLDWPCKTDRLSLWQTTPTCASSQSRAYRDESRKESAQ